MTMNLKMNREAVVTPVMTPEGAEMVLSPMAQAHTTTLEGSDSDAAACPTTTNSLLPTRGEPTTKVEKDSPTRPTKTKLNAAEMPSHPHPGIIVETFACPMLPLSHPGRTAETFACRVRPPPHPGMFAETFACPMLPLSRIAETSACPVHPPLHPGMFAETSVYPPIRATSSAWLPHSLQRPSHRRIPHVSPALL